MSALDDHEERLRSKRDRILSLEKDVEKMNEKMDLMVVSQRETRAAVDSLKVWQIGTMSVLGVVLFVVDKWDLITGLFK
jgi:hypothetical protein